MIVRGSMRKAALALLILPAMACELSEVTIPAGQDELVVEAILRANDPVQRMLLHRTLDGPTIRGEPGAQVRVIDEAGDVYRFEEGALEECIATDTLPDNTEASCYVSLATETSWVRPEATYELDIVSAQDEHVQGRTTVPADFRLVGAGEEGSVDTRCTLAPQQGMRVEWSKSGTATSYMSQIGIHGLPEALEGSEIPDHDIPDPLRLTGVAVSADDTHMQLPESYGIAERFDLNQDLMRAIRTGFPAGIRIDLFVLAVDLNVVNTYRDDDGSGGPYGNQRAAGIVGDGSGLFGSAVPHYLGIDVTEEDAGQGCEGRE